LSESTPFYTVLFRNTAGYVMNHNEPAVLRADKGIRDVLRMALWQMT
jgi:hypothetical protein